MSNQNNLLPGSRLHHTEELFNADPDETLNLIISGDWKFSVAEMRHSIRSVPRTAYPLSKEFWEKIEKIDNEDKNK
jgi:hypothetical protein